MTHDPQLDIEPLTDPLGFRYGDDCFGPPVETRELDAIRRSLLNPDCDGPETVYAIAMDVGKKKDRPVLEDLHLLYGVVTYAKGRLGREPVRSQGHIHAPSAYARGWSTPEIYEIWQGRAIIYMQETAEDDPGKCYAVHAGPGDVVIVPPLWAHTTISADPETPLTFGAWCDREYSFEYDAVRAHQGLAWFPLYDGDRLTWCANTNYKETRLIEKEPDTYHRFGIQEGKSIYALFEDDNRAFEFVPRPDRFEELWENFKP